MTHEFNIGDRTTQRFRWIARVWSAPILVYALIMLLGYGWNLLTIGTADPSALEDSALIEVLPPILMFVSILGLGIAWRWERLGAIISLIFILAVLILLLIQAPIRFDHLQSMIPYLLSIGIAVPGILFLVCWQSSRSI